MITKVFSPVLHGVGDFVFRANGRHRMPRLLPDAPFPAPAEPVHHGVLDEATLDDLLGPWPVPAWVGAVVATCFDDCPTCEQATAGVLHKDGWTRGQCLTPVAAGGGGRG